MEGEQCQNYTISAKLRHTLFIWVHAFHCTFHWVYMCILTHTFHLDIHLLFQYVHFGARYNHSSFGCTFFIWVCTFHLGIHFAAFKHKEAISSQPTPFTLLQGK